MSTLLIKKYFSAISQEETVEFFINDLPLSELLDRFYDKGEHVLENWKSVFGNFSGNQSEIIKIKQLLFKQVSDEEIRKKISITMDL